VELSNSHSAMKFKIGLFWTQEVLEHFGRYSSFISIEKYRYRDGNLDIDKTGDLDKMWNIGRRVEYWAELNSSNRALRRTGLPEEQLKANGVAWRDVTCARQVLRDEFVCYFHTRNKLQITEYFRNCKVTLEFLNPWRLNCGNNKWCEIFNTFRDLFSFRTK
jgi:hypothetical protein